MILMKEEITISILKYFDIPERVPEAIKTIIYNFEASQKLDDMQYGEDYYRVRNTEIMKRKMLVYTEVEGVPVEMEDPYKSNNKIPSGLFKILVDQKINYSLGQPIKLELSNEDLFYNVVGKKFDNKVRQLGKEASKKGVAWLHTYITQDGLFDYKIIPSEQIIPVYDDLDDDKLALVIRYYDVEVFDKDGDKFISNRVEVWNKETVTYYVKNNQTNSYELYDGKYEYSDTDNNKIFENPRYHFHKKLKYGNNTSKVVGLSWGEIPFIHLYNNDEEETDLRPVKNSIDVLDKVVSDFANNLEDFQDVYWVLKGYNGENVGEFLDQVKRYKVLKVDEDGDARSEKVDIPVTARESAIKQLETMIYTTGQGVNVNQIGDGNVTNVVIKSRYANLDLKASNFEQEVRDFINEFIYFVNRYLELKRMGNVQIGDIVFNRSMIINQVELLDANAKQLGVISETTRLNNHPWIKDVNEEKEEIEKEKESNLALEPDVNLDEGSDT